MRRLEVLSAARDDLLEAAAYYELQRDRLGEAFTRAFKEAVQLLMDRPKASRLISKRVRKRAFRRFPYAVAYRYHEAMDTLTVVAVIHQHRGPRYWRDRLN